MRPPLRRPDDSARNTTMTAIAPQTEQELGNEARYKADENPG
jgi:hypothetical protein